MIIIIAAGIILAFCVMRVAKSLIPVIVLVFVVGWVMMTLGITSPSVVTPQPAEACYSKNNPIGQAWYALHCDLVPESQWGTRN